MQSTITKHNDRPWYDKAVFFFLSLSLVSSLCAFKRVHWWVSNDRVWITLSACHSCREGGKKAFQAYLLQACVTNDCFVPLTQWGGLSQASCSSLAGVWVLASWHVQKFDKKKTRWQHFHEYLNSLPFKQQSVKWGRQHAASVSDLSRFQDVPGFWLRR